jgi:Flp pilus assembly pilin Flp
MNKEAAGPSGETPNASHRLGGFTAAPTLPCQSGGSGMDYRFYDLFHEEQGQDIAEYAVMLAVILVIVVGTIRLIGSNANNVFSQVASSIQ